MQPRIARLAALPPVVELRAVLRRYGDSGGGLLADGLAFAALFAIVPGVLLTITIVGLVTGDPARRADAITAVAVVLPPLRDLMQAVLDQANQSAGALGIVGLATLAWGASRFVVSFANALDRVMARPRHRSLLERNAIALLAVVVLPLAIVVAAALAGLVSFIDAAESAGVMAVVGTAAHVALSLLPQLAIVGAVALIYRVVPLPAPRWRALALPAIAAGLALVVLAQAFAFLAPRLIGAAALLGTLAAVFAALAWLGLSFQAVLIGAAWVGVRDDAANARTTGAPGGGPPPDVAGPTNGAPGAA